MYYSVWRSRLLTRSMPPTRKASCTRDIKSANILVTKRGHDGGRTFSPEAVSLRSIGYFLSFQFFRAVPYLSFRYRSVGFLLEINHNGLAGHEEASVRFRKQLLRFIAKWRVLHEQVPVVLSNYELEESTEKVNARICAKCRGINLGECVFFRATIRPAILFRNDAGFRQSAGARCRCSS